MISNSVEFSIALNIYSDISSFPSVPVSRTPPPPPLYLLISPPVLVSQPNFPSSPVYISLFPYPLFFFSSFSTSFLPLFKKKINNTIFTLPLFFFLLLLIFPVASQGRRGLSISVCLTSSHFRLPLIDSLFTSFLRSIILLPLSFHLIYPRPLLFSIFLFLLHTHHSPSLIVQFTLPHLHILYH